MSNDNIYFIPEKVIRVHSAVHEKVHHLPVKSDAPLSMKEVIFYASKCMHLRKKLEVLLKEDCDDMKYT